MPNIYRTFNEYANGPLADSAEWDNSRWDNSVEFTDVVTAAGSAGGKRVRRYTTGPGGGRGFIRFVPFGNHANANALVEFTVNTQGFATNTNYMWIIARASGNASTTTRGYIAQARWLAGATRLRLGKYVNGTFTALGDVPITMTNGVTYHMRMECIGTTIRARFWPAAEAEPTGSWTISQPDSSITEAESWGFGGVLSTEMECFVERIAFNEDAAAEFVEPSTAPVLTEPTATSITETTATIGATTDSATGTLYAVVTTSATQPSVAQIKAGENDGGTAAVWAGNDDSLSVGANTFSVTGLSAGQTYHAYFVQNDGEDDSNVLPGSFQTVAADVTPPTIQSATVPTAGNSITLTFSEPVNFGAGGNGGFALTASGGASAMTYASGAGTTSLVYNLGRTIGYAETITLAYTQPGNGVEDAAGNDLASFSAFSVDNNVPNPGDVTPPVVQAREIPSNGLTLSLGFSEPVVFGAGGNGGFTLSASGGAATLTYSSGASSSTLIYTISREIQQGETVTLSYTQPGNGVEDLAGNDLASFSASAVTNNSTYTPPAPPPEPPPVPDGFIAMPGTVTPAGMAAWMNEVNARLNALGTVPAGASVVLATDDQAVADANPDRTFIVIE
jgi:uncharacterized repeat protein (TIGR02059 family)